MCGHFTLGCTFRGNCLSLSQHLTIANSFIARVGPHAQFPSSFWDLVWLGHAQVICIVMHGFYAWSCTGSMHGHAQVLCMVMHGFYTWECTGSMHAITTADTQWINLHFAAINKQNE